jgi:predicted AAA+ superfamily ATPase
MYTRLLERPLQVESSFFLFGPRGTGKTTWLKKNFPRAIYLDLLDSALYTDLLAHPERLRTLVPKGGAHAVIIDEVQRVPELLNEVHRLIESEGTRFILTGSSARALRRRGVNLLAGRALTFHMHPLTCAELGSDFSLHGSLLHGNLPLAHSAPDPQLFLKSYVQSYLREEVLQEGLTRNIGAFSRFLEAASFSQASILNVSETARECAVERKTVSGYFQVLEDLLLSVTVPVFSRKAKRRLVSHTKFYYCRPAGPARGDRGSVPGNPGFPGASSAQRLPGSGLSDPFLEDEQRSGGRFRPLWRARHCRPGGQAHASRNQE